MFIKTLPAAILSRSGAESRRMQPADIFGSAALLWPALITAEAARLTSHLAQDLAGYAGETLPAPSRGSLRWTTANVIALELPTMRLRDFSTDTKRVPTLICAPFALHGANITDFAHHHSLVAALLAEDIGPLLLTEWRSATAEMRFFSIDTYLADLNVAVDHMGGKADLIGICQGGWMALIYAGRFPLKVRKLVIAGAPVDLAVDSAISRAAKSVPLSVFKELVELGKGCLLGRRMLGLWGWRELESATIQEILQLPADESRLAKAREARFRAWNATTVDLPGTYYLEVVQWIFQENRLAEGRLVALGQRVDPAVIRQPIFLLAARDDQFVMPGQVLNTARLVGTADRLRGKMVVAGSHLSLFMGRRTLADTWPRIAGWLGATSPSGRSHHRAAALPARNG
jgi:poly(3-hydroxyalkanoate) synthetase